MSCTEICRRSDWVNETDDVLCSDKESSFFNALQRPIKPPPRMTNRFIRCSMDSATGLGIGPIKMASFADLKRLVNVPRFAIFPLCCVKVCSAWLEKNAVWGYLPQSFVDVVGGATVNLTGIAGDCVAKPILVVHKSALRSRLLWFCCLIILPDFGWTEFQIEL